MQFTGATGSAHSVLPNEYSKLVIDSASRSKGESPTMCACEALSIDLV